MTVIHWEYERRNHACTQKLTQDFMCKTVKENNKLKKENEVGRSMAVSSRRQWTYLMAAVHEMHLEEKACGEVRL